MPEPLLKAENLFKKFTRLFTQTISVHDVTFTLNRGEIVTLIGENGAGKSTTFEMISGMLRPNSGKISLFNDETGEWMDITSMPLYQRARYGIGYLPQRPSIFANLTTRQNLFGIMELMDSKVLMRRIKDFDENIQTKEEFCTRLLEKFGLNGVANHKAKSLSGGEKRRLEIARLFIGKPRLVLMDEPYAGVDDSAIGMCEKLFREVRDSGVAFLIVDHRIPEMMRLADRIIYMKKGNILFSGTKEHVLSQPGIEDTLLKNFAISGPMYENAPVISTSEDDCAATIEDSEDSVVIRHPNVVLKGDANVKIDD